MKVTQNVTPTARAKRTASSTIGNLVMHLVMDWSNYVHLGMTPAIRDRVIAGLRDGSVQPAILCETLGIPTQAIDRDRELLASAQAEVERATQRGIRVLGVA